MAFMHSCIHISVDRCVDYFLFLLDCCMHFVVAVFLDCFILYKCPACDQNFSAFPRVTSMDHKKVSCLHFDLNSEPENSYYSEIDMSCPVDLNSGPESSYASSQNQQTNSYLPIDLNLLPEKSFLRYDINWVLEKVYRPSPNQQSNSSFRSKDDNQLFLSKKKRSQDAVEKKKDETIAKRLKADREKKRRDKLNGSFQELGDILDVDRHKNNKRDIIVEAIHVLKDLTSELNRQKVQHAALTEESRELMEEKNELKSEKASLKSEIENLELLFQHSLSFMHQWAAPVDPSVSYPIALLAPSRPVRIGSPRPSPQMTHVVPSIGRPYTSVASASNNPGQQNPEQNPSNCEGYEVVNVGSRLHELELMPGSITKKFSAIEKGKQPMVYNGSSKDWSFIRKPSSSGRFPGSCSYRMHGDLL